nr:MAG TPA: hypothetical protein [Microviridae sp.]
MYCNNNHLKLIDMAKKVDEKKTLAFGIYNNLFIFVL